MSQFPNIILISADQWRGDCMGYFHNHPVMTPHINQLAAEGVAFTNAYADCPICMPQRASILTGRSASSLGIAKNFEDRTPVDPATSLPALLRKHCGYQTKGIGKMHFEPERARFGFDHITLHPNDYIMYLEENGFIGGYRRHGMGGNEVYPVTACVPEQFYHTNWIVDQAVKYMYQREQDIPFFLWMVFEAPHCPYDPPAPYDRMYDNFTIPVPVVGEWEGSRMPPDLQKKIITQKLADINEEINRESRRRYYGQITNIDYQLGRLIGELRARNIYDNTLIIFTSDHGEMLGDHNLFGKSNFLRGSGDVPLIVKPSQSMEIKGAGWGNSSPVLTVDIFATILHTAGIPIPEGIDGVSLYDVATNKAGRSRICGEFGDGYGSAFCFDGRYKYIYYANGAVEQLFDIESDPRELHDISLEEKMSAIKKGLREYLIVYLQKYNRPMVQNGTLTAKNIAMDESALRKKNVCGLRAPLHFGQGYGGLAGS